MIDIHCHILPGIDDGAPNEQEGLKMARKAVEEGITGIIATPHHKNGAYENPRIEVMRYVSNFNKILNKAQIPLKVFPGQEPRISGELLEDYERGEILSLNDRGQYLFIELPHHHVPRYTGQLLYDIQIKGLTPIIVHPERNQEILNSPEWLYKFVVDGALTQITAASVTGYFGKQIKRFTFDIIESNLTHFVSSDAHNVGNRTFRLRQAYGELESEFGTDTKFFLQENAELLLDGKNVVKEVPEPIKRKKFLGLF